MKPIFLTGGGGFVGSRLLETLVAGGRTVIALDRSRSIANRHPASLVRVVNGDLLEPATYRQALAEASVVVHLAAATGKASREEHFRANAEGTEALIGACREAGVDRMLFVSSIATSFSDTRDYHYAQAKARAESAVRASGLRVTIVRPTIVLGAASPIQGALEKLALLPIIPIFGDGRARVQPIHVDDAAALIAGIVAQDRFAGETIDIGGPEVLTMEALLQRIRQARTGRPGRVIHLPLGLILPPLRLAEAAGLGRVLPVSVGQLSSFRFDGLATTGDGRAAGPSELKTIAAMVSPHEANIAPAPAGLQRECRVFAAHLLGLPPSEYALRKYLDAHQVSGAFATGDRFDRFLVRLAARHRVLTKISDAYARVFAPASALRRKLVLLLAILETSPASYRVIDEAAGRSKAALAARLAVSGIAAIISLVAGTILLIPARLVLGSAGRKSA
jgi:nucleoside-diphosphate-sugar epimerase